MSQMLSSLRRHMEALCQNDRAPHTPGYRTAQVYLRNEIERMGLKAQEHQFKVWGLGHCTNIFCETGSENAPRILLGAHYESRDVSGCGADDNASAVAVVLETLRALKDRSDIAVTAVLFDMEENWKWGSLRGSRSFARFYQKPLSRVIIFDLVGGALTPELEPTYLQFGEALPALKHPELEFLHLPLPVLEPMGSMGARSDYDEFRKMKVPFTFFSSGTPWYYHTPFDNLDIIRWDKMKKFTEALIQELSKTRSSIKNEASWSTFKTFVQRVAENRNLATPLIRRLAEQERPPSRWEIIRLYMNILPVIRELGPNLWPKDQTEPISANRPSR